ncbi:MAG: hypothetical protein DRQ88_13160 [Epsilonproteobacteria bacterium]|nr:MAG: hypothetical protein DRQ88_13160 [Campylobacterota bacterium]
MGTDGRANRLNIFFLGGKQAGCIGLLTTLAVGCRITGVVAYDGLVRGLAEKMNLPTFQSINEEGCVNLLYASDLIVCVHGREIIPNNVLEIPLLGGINVHPCLYKYKGSNPIGRLLSDGNPKASVGVHHMMGELDSGGVIAELFVDVSNKNTIVEVYNELYPIYSMVLLEALVWLRDN